MRRRFSALRCAIILSATLVSMPALAQDAAPGPGHVATGPIFDLPSGMSVERLEVHISIYSVRLAYVFKSPAHQSVHFSFALPEMSVDADPDIAALDEYSEAAGLAADTKPANYLYLSVTVNGQKLALDGHGRALLDGKDVTRQLLDAGVPLLSGPVGESPWLHLPPQVQAKLEASGLIHGDTAQWTYQADFAWDQTFEPGETRVEVSYGPAFYYWGDINRDRFPKIATEGSATRAYCIDDAVRRTFLSGEHPYELYIVTHRTAPAGRWHGPVGQYRLVVDKGATANFVAFCPFGAKKISPTTFEWTATNYTQGREIGVLFFNDPERPDTAGANK